MTTFIYYSDNLRENLSKFDNYAPFIDWGPDLLNLLCSLLDIKDLSKDLRLKISAAIAYYVVPNDIIPEDVYGPYGYVDDIFISVYVLRKLADELSYDILAELWDDDSDVKEVMDECYDKSLGLLEDNVYDILNYVGLID